MLIGHIYCSGSGVGGPRHGVAGDDEVVDESKGQSIGWRRNMGARIRYSIVGDSQGKGERALWRIRWFDC